VPPAAAGVAAIGAVFDGETDSGGAVVPPPGVINVESFSALGGDLPIAIDPHGQRFADGPGLRFKPDPGGPDGVHTTFFGTDNPCGDDLFPHFPRTSAPAPPPTARAAPPLAAAVAALVRQAVPALAPDALLEVLRSTARDVEAPGRDALSGDGLVDADAALGALIAPPTATASPPPTPTPSTAPTATL